MDAKNLLREQMLTEIIAERDTLILQLWAEVRQLREATQKKDEEKADASIPDQN